MRLPVPAHSNRTAIRPGSQCPAAREYQHDQTLARGHRRIHHDDRHGFRARLVVRHDEFANDDIDAGSCLRELQLQQISEDDGQQWRRNRQEPELFERRQWHELQFEQPNDRTQSTTQCHDNHRSFEHDNDQPITQSAFDLSRNVPPGGGNVTGPGRLR